MWRPGSFFSWFISFPTNQKSSLERKHTVVKNRWRVCVSSLVYETELNPVLGIKPEAAQLLGLSKVLCIDLGLQRWLIENSLTRKPGIPPAGWESLAGTYICSVATATNHLGNKAYEEARKRGELELSYLYLLQRAMYELCAGDWILSIRKKVAFSFVKVAFQF